VCKYIALKKSFTRNSIAEGIWKL